MKYLSYVTFCAILLCCSILRGQSAITLSAADVKFLSGCGVRQDDIMIAKLDSEGQERMLDLLSATSHSPVFTELKDFMETRDYLRKFTPTPSTNPEPPVNYQSHFLTSARTGIYQQSEQGHSRQNSRESALNADRSICFSPWQTCRIGLFALVGGRDFFPFE